MPRFEEVAEDALTTVRLVPRWQLEPAAWASVAACLARLADAIAARDARAVHRALTELEDHGPTRLSAIRRDPSAGDRRAAPPPAILDVVNTLVHPARGWNASTDPAGPSRDPGMG